MMLTSGAALLIACLGFVAYDLILIRRAMTNDLQTLAEMVGNLNTAALTFGDPRTARENLSSLKDKKNIVAAVIYDKDGELFAAFPQTLDPQPLAGGDRAQRTRFVEDFLEVVHPIELQRDTIGYVLLRSDLEQMYSRLQQYAGIVMLLFLVSAALAYALSARLQKVISRPILALAGAARSISDEKNYSVRVPAEHSAAEIAQLISAFNEMLAQIQARDAALERARGDLEKRVEERTAELKQAVEKLTAVASKLEQSNRELQDFAYVASHDLQEPLRKVQAFGDRLRTKFAVGLGEEGIDFLTRMQNAAARMQNLINDLLLFSRVSTKTNPFQKVNLEQVVREVLSDLEIRLQQSGGAVHIHSLPELEADPSQMRQLFQNLIGNALKFHQPGVPPIVRIDSRPIAAEEKPAEANAEAVEMCQITISDNGIGFDEKYLSRIFTVFQRLHGRGTYEGTGIGLAICRKIAERHGGTISARSQPGHGATFIVTLPCKQGKGTNV
jgi:signal transduction histidine kinase